ncbi:MAG TPA: FG-GAP repeat protein, partial [Gammaproteobacteria bacterium]|nr:FG-GAP repeat protein [Gammaproteobacteria bacterium]
MIFTIFARTAWSATGLIVQNFLVAGGRPVISGNSIAVNNFIALLGGGPTSIYELDSGGYWNLTQTLPTGGPAAISGNTLLLGNVPAQPLTFNPAAVYVSDAAGNWTQQALLSAPDTNDYDEYGTAVAVDGNIAVVGAEVHGRGESATGNSYGAAYIFQRDSTGSWSLVQELLPPALDPAGNPVIQFGASVAVSGKTLLVYANEQVTVGNVTNSNPQIYVYGEQNNGNWVLQTVLSGPYSTVATNPITIQGNQIAVQTPVATDDSDKVDVYVPDASGTWNLSQALSGASVQITGPPGQTFG